MNKMRSLKRRTAYLAIFLSCALFLASCAGSEALQTPTPGSGAVSPSAQPAEGSPTQGGSAGPAGVISQTPAFSGTPAGSLRAPGSTAAPAQPFLPGPASVTPVPTADPVQGLQKALGIADQEMNAAASSASLEQARAHAEIAVNVLVGYWGVGYGDGDGDGKIDDASSRYGVLPAGRVQEAAPGTGAAYTQLGWAILVDETLGSSASQPIQSLLGDTQAWKNDPVGSYNQIQAAIEATDPSHPEASKLGGQVPKAVAWGRLVLIKAQTLEDAKAYASRGSQATSAALQTANQIH